MRRRYYRRKKGIAKKEQPFFREASPAIQTKEEKQPFFQTKEDGLKVGAPGDKYEVEADAMADAVMSNSPNSAEIQPKEITGIQRASEEEAVQAKIQRQAAEEEPAVQTQGEEEDQVQMQSEEEEVQTKSEEEVQMRAKEEEVQAKSEEEEVQMQADEEEVQMKEADEDVQMKEEEEVLKQEEEELQTKTQATSKASRAGTQLSNRIQQSSGSGSPIPSKTQKKMETAFGMDFSKVSIHTNGEAVQMNKELNALAFTHGKDIYFNQGKFNPESSQGQHLLAHELTHVVQQDKNPRKINRQVGRENDQLVDAEGSHQLPILGTWQSRVQEARGISSEELSLINSVLIPNYSAYPDLVFPVRLFNPSIVRMGGVYYDPELSTPGRTLWAQESVQSRELIAVRRLQQPDPAPNLDINQADSNLPANTVINYIKLGPASLSEGTKAFTRSILYHEYQHFSNHMRDIQSGWSAISERSSHQGTSSDHDEHGLIYARTFRRFFRHYEWHGNRVGRGDPMWQNPGDRNAAEAMNDLGAIQRMFFPTCSQEGRSRILQEILAVRDDHPGLTMRLREIIDAMSPDLRRYPEAGRLKTRLLESW